MGSAAIGLRSAKHVVVATLKRSTSELSSYQKKVFKIDDNVGIAIAGQAHTPEHSGCSLKVWLSDDQREGSRFLSAGRLHMSDKTGSADAGLVADARVLAKYMRTECINHRYVYDEPMQVRGMRAQGIGRAQRDGRLTGAKRQAQMQPIDTGKSRWGRHLWI